MCIAFERQHKVVVPKADHLALADQAAEHFFSCTIFKASLWHVGVSAEVMARRARDVHNVRPLDGEDYMLEHLKAVAEYAVLTKERTARMGQQGMASLRAAKRPRQSSRALITDCH